MLEKLLLVIGSFFGELFSRDTKAEHTRWLIQRLPHMMDFDDPTLFDRPEYQKEGLLILLVSAQDVDRAWRSYSRNPSDGELQGTYQHFRNIYTYDVQTLQQAHPIFKDLDIHWSKLPEFIKRWQKKNPAMWDQKAMRQVALLEAV